MQRLIGLTVAAILLTSACGDHRRYTSVSPDSGATVVVREPRGIWSGIRVTLSENGHDAELCNITGDYMFTVAEVYWSPDGETAGVFSCGSPIIELAVKRGDLTPVPFATVWPFIREQLRARYNLSEGENVRDWVCFHGGTEEVVRRFGNGTN
jgi:hypothetical protein